MKKLTLLVALILCVTIGGVYATWVYPGTEVAAHKDPLANKMADVTFQGAAGSYSAEGNTLALVVDQESETSFNAVLEYTGSVTIKFTADNQIADSALAAALGATITVEATDLAAATYGGTQIYALNTGFSKTLSAGDWTKTGNVYSYTLNAADLASAISLNGTFNLPTYDDYVAFQAAQMKAVFRIVVTAAPVASVTP